jgi:aspartyl-tRNA(Asn)/glutamyl-tRNA(Gln) amidotransferase subunit A
MSDSSRLHLLSAVDVREAFIRKEVSAQQIADHFLSRAEKANPDLNAFLSLFRPQAMMRAEALDRKRERGEPLGKLAAVPVALKDNMHLAGELTTCASRFLSNYRAPFNASAVSFLQEEDALFIGKTNLDEFAMGSSNENSAFGKVKNPWDLEKVPGGSSGGSAAAIAARLALLATGSDTGGSIRQPAAFSGIVGFKPTYGRVSRYGLVAFASSLDQIGPMTTTVADAALMMEVIGRHCPYDATSLDLPPEPYPLAHPQQKGLSEITVGVPYALIEQLSGPVRANFDAALAILKELGAELIDVDLSPLRYSVAVYYILATAEASTNLARFDGIRFGQRAADARSLEEVYEMSRKEGFGREVKKRIMLGTYVLSAGFQDAYYRRAQKVRTLVIRSFQEAFEQCDTIAMPVAPSSAFPLGAISDPLQMYLQDIFTIPANLAGLPAISVPSGFDPAGLPLGLQLIAPQMHDVPLLQYAYAYEQATQFTKRLPPRYEQGAL